MLNQHGGHGHQKKAREQSPPLPQGGALPIPQGGGEGAEVGGAWGDGAYIAVKQKRGEQGHGHDGHRPLFEMGPS